MLEAWRYRLKFKSALRGYPIYAPPHLCGEAILSPEEAEENFAFFMRNRESRLHGLADFMKRFSVETSTDSRGLAAMSDWFDRDGGLILHVRPRSAETLHAFVEYDPPWTGKHIGINLTWDIATYVGECIIARRPSAHWALNTEGSDPLSTAALGFQRPWVAGLYWPPRCDVLSYVYLTSESMSDRRQGRYTRYSTPVRLVDFVKIWSKQNPPTHETSTY